MRTRAHLEALYRARLDEDLFRRGKRRPGVIDVESRRVDLENRAGAGTSSSESGASIGQAAASASRTAGGKQSAPTDQGIERRTPTDELLESEEALTYRPGQGPNNLEMTHAPTPRGFLIDFIA